jgi:hypothetical protein
LQPVAALSGVGVVIIVMVDGVVMVVRMEVEEHVNLSDPD